MNHRLRVLFTILALLANAAFAAPPSQIAAEYDIDLDGLPVAHLTENFTLQNGRYRIESVSRTVGLAALFKPETMRIISQGSITAQGLHPDKVEQIRERHPERNSHADFDWENHRLTLHDASGSRNVALPEDTQDRLSAMYQFLFLDLSGQTTLRFHMTNGSKLDSYDYRLTPAQRIEVPQGEFSTLYVATPPQPNGAKTEIWLATEQQQMPVKMIVTEGNGNRYTQVLTRLTLTP